MPQRCEWAPLEIPNYLAYHDEEWGLPSHDDVHLFEMLTLEGAQAGLSWSTIPNKRQGYRRTFAGFDAAKVARFTPAKVERLLQDPGIVRNRLKVESTVNNAARVLEVQREFGSRGPAVLVDEPVVERADQHEVVQVGPAAVTPPADVVSFDEPAGAAAGETALAVAIANLAHHPCGRLTGGSAETEDVPVPILGDDLHPAVTQHPLDRVRVDHRTVLDFTAIEAGGLQPSV